MFIVKYKYSFLAGVLAGAAALTFMVRALDSFAMGPVGNERVFDQAAWKRTNDVNIRFEMSDDLQIHYLRRGMKKRSVLKLLGKPEGSGHYSSGYSDTSRVISYDMGYMFLDPCTFDLEFSKDGKLLNYEVNCN